MSRRSCRGVDFLKLINEYIMWDNISENVPNIPKLKCTWTRNKVISHKVFFKSFCRSELPHKSFNVSFYIANMTNTLTNLCGNRLLQNDFENTFCEIRGGWAWDKRSGTCIRRRPLDTMLSHTMYQLHGFRKLNPPTNRQLVVLNSNNKQ